MFRSKLANPFVNSMQLHARALTGDHKLRIIWKKLPPNMGAGYNFDENVILMPKVNTTLLTQSEMNKLKALSYHERLHHALSCKDAFNDCMDNEDGIVQNLFQVIEDCRIEMNENYRLPGDIADLEFYRTQIFVPEMTKDCPAAFYLNPWGSLMMLIKMNLPGYANEIPIPELQKYYDDAIAILSNGRFENSCKVGREGSKVSAQLAKEIRDAWQEEAEDDENMKEGPSMPGIPQLTKDNAEQSQGEQGESGEGSGQGGDEGESQEGEGQEGEGSASGNDSDNDQEGEGSGKGEENSDSQDSDGDEQGEGSGSENDSQSDKDGKGPQSNDEGHGTEENVPGDIEKQFLQAQGNDNGWQFDNDSLNKEVAELGNPDKDSKRGKELAEIAEEADDLQNSLSNDESASRRYTRTKKKFRGDTESYVPYNVFDRTLVANEFPDHARALKSAIGPKIGQTRKELMKVLLGMANDQTQTCLKRGRLDQRMLHKIPKHDHRVFSRTVRAKRLTCDVQIVIDLSGSMCSGHPLSRAEVSAQMCMLLGECLSVLNIPFEIIGFNTSPAQYSHYYDETPSECSNEAAEAERNGMDRCHDLINRWIFKEFNETYRACFNRLGALSVDMNTRGGENRGGTVGGCNVDHEVILWGASRLWQQRSERKIQIVLSDGQPSGFGGDYGGLLDRMLVLTNAKIAKSGIEQYCFSIQSECCRHYYRNWHIVNDISDLNSQALKFLASAAGI